MEDAVGKLAWSDIEKLVNALVPVDLIERRGKRQAAEVMDVSPQALHKRLAKLAHLLGVRSEDIVEPGRNPGHTVLGKHVQELCTDIDSRVKKFLIEVEEFKTSRINRKPAFRLAIIQSIWDVEKDWLKPEFEKAMSGTMSLEPVIVVAHDAHAPLLDGRADAAIGYPPRVLNPKLDKEDWRSEPLMLVVSEECAERTRVDRPHMFSKNGRPNPATPRDIRDIDNKKFYVMTRDAPMFDLVENYLRVHDIPVHPQRLEERSTVLEALGLISRDDGIGLLPTGNVAGRNDVVAFPLTKPLYRPVSILFPRRALRRPLEAFRKCVTAHNNPFPVNKSRRPLV